MAGFDEHGKVVDPDALRSVMPDARKGTRSKVTDESTEHATITRVHSDTERAVHITPHTVDLGRED